MRIVGLLIFAAFVPPGLMGPLGCQSSSDETAVGPGNDAADVGPALPVAQSGKSADEFDGAAGNEDPYGLEPLVPAIRLGDDPHPASAGLIRQPIVGGPGEPGGLLTRGLASGILAPDFTAGDQANFHPHGQQVCASGCAASNHPTPELSRSEFRRQLSSYQQGPLDETNASLEALLYYGLQSSALLGSSPSTILDSAHEQFLRRELKRTHALFSFRIVDEQGIVRVQMNRVRVPFDRRHEFDMETTNLQPLVTSGTVKRVGLHHLWTRI